MGVIKYNTFKKYISELESVKSSSGKAVYKGISVDGDFVHFYRNDNDNAESISIEEMYRYFIEQPIGNINTYFASNYISGKVQTPAVAIIQQVYRRIEELEGKKGRFGDIASSFVGLGIAALLVFGFLYFIISFIISASKGDLDYFDVTETNVPCVVTHNTIGIYNSDDIKKVEELMMNEDVVALELLREAGYISMINEGSKCTYIRYIKGGYVVIQMDNLIRPIIINKEYIKKE